MTRTLQVRDVPDELHTAVRARAAEANESVSQYLLELIAEHVRRPSTAEFLARATELAQMGGGATREDVVAAVRAGRDR